MIYDFSCSGQTPFLEKTIHALPGALAVLVLSAGLAALGSQLNRQAGLRALDIIYGWSLSAAVMTLAAVTVSGSLPYVALMLGIAMH